jgi:hypothetical protein
MSGIYFSRTKKKWAAQTRVRGRMVQIGAYDTPEDAVKGYSEFKLKQQSEPSPSDLKRLERYKEFCAYCHIPRTISELFAYFYKANSSSIRSLAEYLSSNGFVSKTIRDSKTNAKDKYHYQTIKNFTKADLKPIDRSYQVKVKAEVEPEKEKTPGATIISFDSGVLREKYTQQRKADRLSAKISKTYVSGSSLNLL